MPTFAPNFQYPEDIPHVSGDRGTAALAVRRDLPGSLVDTNGDYTLLQVDGNGRLRTNPAPDVKFARIDVTAAGNTEVVAAVVGKHVRVLGYMITTQTANAAVNIQFRSGATTVLAEIRDIDGLFTASYAGGVSAPAFETAVGEALNVNLSAAKVVGGHLSYMEVD